MIDLSFSLPWRRQQLPDAAFLPRSRPLVRPAPCTRRRTIRTLLGAGSPLTNADGNDGAFSRPALAIITAM